MSIEYRVKNRNKHRYEKIKKKIGRPQSVASFERESIKSGFSSKKQTQIAKLVIKDNDFKHLGLTCSSWFIYDQLFQKCYGFRQTYQRQIASLTKIMTTILSLQLMQKFKIPLNLYVKVTNTSANLIGTSASLQPGTWITIYNLLYGTILPSGNDAAMLLAEVLGYHLVLAEDSAYMNYNKIECIDLSTQSSRTAFVNRFIREMNTRALELNMICTRYSNPHGLQNALNISSARDIGTLSIHSSKHPVFSQVMNAQYHNYEYYQDYERTKKFVKRWWNTNALLKKGWCGVKTGQTLSAGSCLSSLKDGVFIVVLNCQSLQARFIQTQKLHSWYEKQFRQTFKSSIVNSIKY